MNDLCLLLRHIDHLRLSLGFLLLDRLISDDRRHVGHIRNETVKDSIFVHFICDGNLHTLLQYILPVSLRVLLLKHLLLQDHLSLNDLPHSTVHRVVCKVTHVFAGDSV